MCTPSGVGKPRLRVSSRRYDIFSSTKWHESHTLDPTPLLDPPPAPADVMHVPASGLPSSVTTARGIIPFGVTGAGALMIGLKLFFPILSAHSCSLRKSSRSG